MRTYSVVESASDTTIGWVSVSGTSTFTITATPVTNYSEATTSFTVRLKIVLTSYSSQVGYITFTVNVNRYTCTSLTVYNRVESALLSQYEYTIGEGEKQLLTAPTFTTETYTCVETITYSLSLDPSGTKPDYLTFNSTSRVLTINTADVSIISNINLRITVTRS